MAVLKKDKLKLHKLMVLIILSCSDDPGGAACQRGIADNKAYAGALATGGVALLPGGAQAMWGLGAGANAGINYLTDGTIDPTTAIIGGWVDPGPNSVQC
nr:hypothetical protein [Klebsiella aerogenes]